MPSRNEDRKADHSFRKYIDPAMLADPIPGSQAYLPMFPRSLTPNQKIQTTITAYVSKTRGAIQELCNEMYHMLILQVVAGEFTLTDMRNLRGSQGNAQSVFANELLKDVKNLKTFDPLDTFLSGQEFVQTYC